MLLKFSDERGIFKWTYANRFENFDTEVLSIISSYFDSNNALLVQDTGVSDGRTAVEFFQKISTKFQHIDYYASDYNPIIYVLEKGSTKLTVSSSQDILEIVYPPFVFNVVKKENYWYYPVNHLICFLVEKLVAKAILRAYKSGELKARELLLFSLPAIKLAKTDQRFHLLQHDLLSPFKMQSHVIRVMNILNRSYFSDSEIEQVSEHIYSGLFDGGLLITGSNEGPGTPVQGGVYQKTGNGFKELWKSCDGSPVHNILHAKQFANSLNI